MSHSQGIKRKCGLTSIKVSLYYRALSCSCMGSGEMYKSSFEEHLCHVILIFTLIVTLNINLHTKHCPFKINKLGYFDNFNNFNVIFMLK